MKNLIELWSNSIFNFAKLLTIFYKKIEFGAVQKDVNLVDLEKCCKMSIWLQKSVLIQPRTSLGKSDVSRGSRRDLRQDPGGGGGWAVTLSHDANRTCSRRATRPASAGKAP